jgi:hypothetical protein
MKKRKAMPAPQGAGFGELAITWTFLNQNYDCESSQRIKSVVDTDSTAIGMKPCHTPQISEHCP